MLVTALQPPKGSASVHLDALRGLAAFSVLASHWRDAFFVDYTALPHHNPLQAAAYIFCSLGHQWVIVFFVMSGYLVGGSVLRSRQQGRWQWGAYLLTRLTRLYVVLLPALVIGGLADWAGMHLTASSTIYTGVSGMHFLAHNACQTLTPLVFLQTLLFLQNLHAPEFGSNSALWSLANEFWYYLAFPVLMIAFARAQKWGIRVVCIVALTVWALFAGLQVVLLGIPWLLGALIAVLPAFPARSPLWRGFAIFVAMALFGGGMALFGSVQGIGNALHFPATGSVYGIPFTDLPLSLLVSLLIWVTLHCATAPVPAIYAWTARRAAASSYTLYLIHIPILVFIKASLHLPRLAPGWHGLLVSLAVLVAVLLCAQGVYELFEKNTAQVRNWLKPYGMGQQAVSQSGPA